MKKMIYLLLLPVALSLGCIQQKKEAKATMHAIGEELAQQLQIREDCVILQKEDWNSTDGITCTFSLAAIPLDEEHPSFMDGFLILMESNDVTNYIPLPENTAGYAQGSKMSIITDPNQDMPYVLVTIEYGGSGGYQEFYLYDMNQEGEALLEQSEGFLSRISVSGQFAKNFTAMIHLDTVGTYTIGMQKDKEFLLENGIYNEEGQLINSDLKPWLGGFWRIHCSVNSDEMILLLEQPIIGIAQAQKIGIFTTKWSYSHEKWELMEAGCSTELTSRNISQNLEELE